MTRRLLWGLSAVAVYVCSAFLVAQTGRVIPRPVYDGLAPAAPYRFVSPPPDLVSGNEPPLPGKGVVDLTKDGSAATSISTGDGQLQVVLQEGVFAAKGKEKSVDVRITPVVAAPPTDLGEGLRIEGNAYRIEAKYAKSGETARAEREVTIVLRYPNNGSVMVRRDGNRWSHLETQVSTASLQLFAAADSLGTFAAAGKPHTTWTRWIPYAAGALGVLAGVVGYLSGRRGWVRARRSSKSAPAAKKKKKATAPARKRKSRPRGKRKPGTQV